MHACHERLKGTLNPTGLLGEKPIGFRLASSRGCERTKALLCFVCAGVSSLPAESFLFLALGFFVHGIWIS